MLRVGHNNNKRYQYFVIILINHIDMKNGICLLMVVLTTGICIGQTKKKESKKTTFKESDVIFMCDSLSKVYKVNVVSYKSVFQDGKIKHFICYGDGIELKEKEISKKVK